MTNKALNIVFEEVTTTKELNALKARYKGVVMDMSSDAEFKEARKVRTECNKLTKAINDRRISFTGEVKAHGDELIEKVKGIYAPIVNAFELEDGRRKEEAARIKREYEAKLSAERAKIAEIANFVSEARKSDAAGISNIIEAIDLIDCSLFMPELSQDAIIAKQEALATISEMLQQRAQFEAAEKARIEAEEKAAEVQKAQFVEAEINKIKMMPLNAMGKNSAEIQTLIDNVELIQIHESTFGERYQEAVGVVDTAKQQLSALLQQTKMLEPVAAEPETTEPVSELPWQEAKKQESTCPREQALSSLANIQGVSVNTAREILAKVEASELTPFVEYCFAVASHKAA